MRTCALPSLDGTEDIYQCYTWKEFPYWSLSKRAARCRHKKGRGYLANVATFDIETTTVRTGHGGGCSPSEPYAFMYHWQFCIDGHVAYGRTWMEWEAFLKRLSKELEVSQERRLCIYVHNLGFEYQFMKGFLRRSFGDLEVFATQPRKPLRVETEGGLEFRCSWKLSNMSLEMLAKSERGVLHLKQAGDLDYRKLRTPDTPLTDKEFGYCVGDVVSLYEAVRSKMEADGDDNETIPMTSTGYVRRDCRRAARRQKGYREMFKRCRMTKEAYGMLKEAARGGDTHASRIHAGHMLEDCDSYDVQSSYPYVMLTKRFPMTAFVPYGQIESLEEFRQVREENACLFRATLIGLRPKEGTYYMSPYLSESKCRQIVKGIYDNGRVLYADGLSVTLTDIDWAIVEAQYDWDELYIDDMMVAEYGPLPQALRETIYEYFRRKTELKAKIADIEERLDSASDGGGHTGEELERLLTELAEAKYLYDRSKNRLNGIFGMCFTDPVHDVVTEREDGTWKAERPDIQEALDRYHKGRNSFLVYAWGVWTTAHARAHLARLIDAAGNGSVAYCDTDSGKGAGLDKEAIEAENALIRQECERTGAYYDVGTVRYYLGEYEHETKKARYDRFITLGAKKYAYEQDGELHITISGVRKEAGAIELGSIENFKVGFTFREAGGLEMRYHEKPIHTIEVDGCRIESASDIAVLDSTYTLGVTTAYSDLIGLCID